jgi:regulator of protease activity HflC (stomatin/prohibitin superfamily)
LLTHQKWKFERFINMKIQSEDLRQINVATADNILMNIDATAVWRIIDIEKAAIMVTESMMKSDVSIGTMTDDEADDLSKLRRDVLKQTVSAIARFVSEVNYSDYFHAVSSSMTSYASNDYDKFGLIEQRSSVPTFENPLFDFDRLEKSVNYANKITGEFGVKIVSVSIIAANPSNASLMNSLSTSAIASAEAMQAETHARGMARTMEIEARAAAIAKQIESEADGKRYF